MWVGPLFSSHLQLINHHHNSGQNNALAARPERGNQRSLKGELILTGLCWRRGVGGVECSKTRSLLACTTSVIAQSDFITNLWAREVSPRPKITVSLSSGYKLQGINLSPELLHPSIDRLIYSLVTLNNVKSLRFHAELYYINGPHFPSCQAPRCAQFVLFHMIYWIRTMLQIRADT